MEEGGIRHKGHKRNPSKPEKRSPHTMYERRPLKTVPLIPPEYKINPHVLLDDYLEKDVRFAGVIPNIPLYIDPTNRTDVLRVIDRGKREDHVIMKSSHEQDAIFSLSAHNVKISRRDGKEELLLRIPVHELAAICYVRDDAQHLLAIKFGSEGDLPEMCQLGVMFCDSKATAEEVCSLVNQCFQLVYTEATMQFLDGKLSEATNGLSIGSSTTTWQSDPSVQTIVEAQNEVLDRRKMTVFSHSKLNLDQNGSNSNSTISSSVSQSLPRANRERSSSVVPSESELGQSATELISDYMKKLQVKLNHDELRRFAMLIKAWHTNMVFAEFLDKVLELYGPSRKYLLAGMRPFVPEKEEPVFSAFLERVGVQDPEFEPTRKYRRSSSGNSSNSFGNLPGPGGTDDYDRMLNDISTNVGNLESSVEMSTNPELFMPKGT